MGAQANKQSGEAVTSTVVVGRGGGHWPLRQYAKAVIATLGLLVIVGLVVWGAVAVKGHSTTTAACGSKTDQTLLKQAVTDFDATKVDQLATVVAKIKMVPCYDKNPNYLYAVTQYYVYLSDTTNATHYFGLLQKVHQTNDKLDPAIPGKMHAYTNLQQQVDALNNNANNTQVLQQVVPQ